jgi:hypothetical protein
MGLHLGGVQPGHGPAEREYKRVAPSWCSERTEGEAEEQAKPAKEKIVLERRRLIVN